MQKIFFEIGVNKFFVILLVRNIMGIEFIFEFYGCKIFDKICLKVDNYNDDIFRYYMYIKR